MRLLRDLGATACYSLMLMFEMLGDALSGVTEEPVADVEGVITVQLSSNGHKAAEITRKENP